MLIVVLSICVQLCQSTPILTPGGINTYQSKTPYGCTLPQKFGIDTETRAKFLEDCKSLDRFTKVPVPSYKLIQGGVQPQVCCPQYLDPNSICTPSDAWCPTFEYPEYDYADYFGEDYEFEYNGSGDQEYLGDLKPLEVVSITIATQSCAAYDKIEYKGEFLTECVTLDRCPSLLESPTERIIAPCGFDKEASLMMVCCPTSRVTNSTTPQIKPRYPQANGEPRPVEDRTPKHCRRWKNNDACRLDKDFSGEEYDLPGVSVLSAEIFPFMMSTCMKTCGWGDRGCVDEHVNCPAWARLGLCVTGNSLGFMAHTCRESCGVCGFLSPFNNETQEVGGVSYTNIKDSNFDCGRYKTFCELQEDCTEETLLQDVKGRNVTYVGWGYENEETPGCSTTLINDRFAISASHCFKKFGGVEDLTAGIRQGRGLTVRLNTDFEEVIEIKRAYTHPLYNNIQAYNDIIVVELGRRVPFDFDKYGHTPSCLDRGDQELAGKPAVVQGSGTTETNKGEYRALLQSYVNLISNVECEQTLKYNSTEASSNFTLSELVRLNVENALPYGITYGFVCAKGIENEDGIFSGSCVGDSGGPLFVNITDSNSVNRQTLAGIVSGGYGCGLNVPGWYTKVSTFLPWVNCIIEASRDPVNDQEMVEEKCNKVADCLVPKCLSEEELFRTPDVPSEDDALFTDYGTDNIYDDVLDLRAEEDKFEIPVCISDPQETVAECLSGLGIST